MAYDYLIRHKRRLLSVALVAAAATSCKFEKPSTTERLNSLLTISLSEKTSQITELRDGYRRQLPLLPGGSSDGYFCAVVSLSPAGHDAMSAELARKAVSQSGRWRSMPLDEHLAKGSKYLELSEMTSSLPLTIENGYYYFFDRHRPDELPWYERSSVNFTFAIYDADSHFLYVVCEDT